MDALRKYLDPMVCIVFWDDPYLDEEYIDLNSLSKCKDMRIISLDESSIDPSKVAETLSCLGHLRILDWNTCSPSISSAIFKFAASSKSLRELILITPECRSNNHCTMTPSMANDLVKWIGTQPVRALYMANFTWANQDMRDKIITDVLDKSTLERFTLVERDTNAFVHEAVFNLSLNYLAFNFRYETYFRLNSFVIELDSLNGFISLFRTLLHTRVSRVCVRGAAFTYVWQILAPLLLESQVKTLDVMEVLVHFTDADALHLAESICHFTTIEGLSFIFTPISFVAVTTLLKASPASLKSITFVSKNANEAPSPEFSALNELAQERSIILLYTTFPM
ncbi:hypothetical protein AC1031_011252 [Aphanomyces cochlioides]|nr:hypothetical protein AC1031_011252 [Aphanomyces cochlioides]